MSQQPASPVKDKNYDLITILQQGKRLLADRLAREGG
jgi:hypothetical protein